MSLLCALVIVGLASQSLAVNLGGVCTADSDCSSTITGSYCASMSQCTRKYCNCPSGQVSDGSKCYTPTAPAMKKKIGESCSGDADCQGYASGARCTSNSCSCSWSNMANAADGYNCQPYGNNQQCSSSSGVCGSNAAYGSCSTSTTCACNSNYKWVNSGDVPQPGGCFSSQVTTDLGSGATGCTMASVWYTSPSSTSLKFCAAGLKCLMCPSGDGNTNTFCTAGAASLTAAIVTILLAAIFSLLL